MASRGKNYSNGELIQLCNSVLHISQDPCVGNGQRAECYWEHVTLHYEKNKPGGTEIRGRKSLETKWGDIKHDVSKFIGVYKQVEGLQISGTNEDDTITRAKELYKQNHPKGKAFSFDSCFWILKDCRRWGNPADDMASKKGNKTASRSRSEELDLNQTEPESPTINLDLEPDVGQSANDQDERGTSEVRKRPTGNKRAKEDLKRQKMENDYMKESLRVQNLMANATIARNEFNQGKGTLLKLLQIPIANLNPRVQEIVERWTLAEAGLIAKKLDKAELAPASASLPTQSVHEHRATPVVEATHFVQEHRAAPAVEVEFNGPNVYVPDTLDPTQFMVDIQRQFQGNAN